MRELLRLWVSDSTVDFRSPTVQSISRSHFNNRNLYLGFTYAFGAVAKRAAPPSFDFSNGGGSGH